MAIVNPGKHDWRATVWEDHLHQAVLDRGERVTYVDVGGGDGPVVLLVHGLGASWRVWLENLPALSEDHRVIAVDLPGFGASDPVDDVIDFRAYADLLARLLAHLGIGSVVVVGNSFGGWISAELTRSHPELVVGLVLVDAAGIPGTPRERRKVVTMLRLADKLAPFGSRHRELLTRRPLMRRSAFGFLIARGDELAADLAIHLLPERPSPVFRAVLDEAVRSWSQEWCAEIATLDVRALVIWGGRDKQLPLRHGQEWTRLIRGSRLVVVPTAGHMPMLERPDEVNPLLLDFLLEASGHQGLTRLSG
jgi:pimeloyl-ACP methyl ester carboxylesterase